MILLGNLFERLFGVLAGKRRWLFAAVLAFTGLCVYRAALLEPDEDITSFLPAGDPMVDEFRLVVERFRQQDQLFFDIGMADDAPGVSADLTRAGDILYEQLLASGQFSGIRYRFSSEQGLAILDYIDEHKPELLAPQDVGELEKLLEPNEVAERLADARRRLIEPEGALLKEALRRDPLGLRAIFLAKLGALRGGDDVQLSAGRIWSGDGRHLLLIAEPSFPSTDTLKSEQLFAVVREACAAATAGLATPVKIRYAGGHRGVMDNRTLVRQDLTQASIVSFLGIGLLVALWFRRRLLVLLSFTPVFFGFLTAVGVFSLFTDRASLIIFGSASMLAGLTVDYAIHILYRYDGIESFDRTALGRELAPLTPSMVLGASTTAAAFGSLFFSIMPGQRMLGLFSAICIMAALLFAIIVLPHMLPTRGTSKRALLPIAAWHGRLLEWLPRQRRWAFAIVLVLTAIAGLGVYRVRFDGDLRNLNGLEPETLADEQGMLKHWGGALATTAVVATGKTTAEALRANERVAELLEQMQHQGTIRAYVSVAPLLPSPVVSAANRARWRQYWKDSAERLASTMSIEVAKLGFSPTAFDPFLEELRADGPAEGAAVALDLTSGPLAAVLRDHVAVAEGQTLVLTRLEATRHEELAAIRERLREIPGTMVVNGRLLAEHTGELVVSGLKELALVSLGLVTLLLFLFLRRPTHVLAVIVPVGFAMFWTLGALGLLGIPLNLMNCLFIGLIFGVAEDYSLFLSGALRDGSRRELEHTGGAVTLCALTTLCGFGVLALARHPVFFAMGITTLFGVAFGLVAALLLVPLLVRPPSRHEGES